MSIIEKHLSSKPKISQPDPMRILIGLLKLLMSNQPDSKSIILYVENNHIDPNTYLPSVHQQDIQMPLIYYCCSNPDLMDFFLYLIGKNTNINATMICEKDPTQQIELLYYSQIVYIPTLIEKGCHLDPSKIPMCGEQLLIKGNITKLIALYKHGALNKDQLLQIIHRPGLLFRVLDYLYERVYSLCQQNMNEEHQKKIINEIIKNYLNVFKLFLKNGININQIENNETFLQRILNTYFYEIIDLTLQYQPNYDNIEFLHYSNFDLTNRQVMKTIYTDENYQRIQSLLKSQIPQKIIKKQPLAKKKSSK